MFVEKWLKIVSETLQNSSTSWPKEVVNIIFQYTIVSAKEQYSYKYSQLRLFSARCSNAPCDHKAFSIFKKIKPEKCAKTGKKLSWISKEHKRNNCIRCDCKSSYVSINNYGYQSYPNSNKDYKEKCDYKESFDACMNCSKIEFCQFAEQDDQICLIDFDCHFCKEKICSHQVHEKIGFDAIICANCNNALLLGRKKLLQAKQ
jgi:hypothetical protein